MLRALEIPARFTTGFLVHVPFDNVDETIVITDRNAHAWVEVFYPNLGWIPLEVTPTSAIAGISLVPRAEVDLADYYRERYSVAPDPPGWDQSQFPEPPENGDGIYISREEYIPQVREDITHIVLIVVFASCFIMLMLHLTLSRSLLKKRFIQENTNMAVLSMHRYLVRLRRRARGIVKIPPEIENFVLKARFSQHIITEEERSKVLSYTKVLRTEIYDSKKAFGRFLMNWWFML
jgi:hypothetical protein